jgi:hypothetical protein
MIVPIFAGSILAGNVPAPPAHMQVIRSTSGHAVERAVARVAPPDVV